MFEFEPKSIINEFGRQSSIVIGRIPVHALVVLTPNALTYIRSPLPGSNILTKKETEAGRSPGLLGRPGPLGPLGPLGLSSSSPPPK